MENNRWNFLVYTLILLAIISMACSQITINFDQKGEDDQPDSVEGSTPLNSDTTDNSPEVNPIQEILPRLSDIASELDAGTIDTSTLPDFTILLENDFAQSEGYPDNLPGIQINVLPTDITGVGIYWDPIAHEDRVKSWYDNGARGWGSSEDLGKYCSALADKCLKSIYVLPPGKSANDVIDIAVTHWSVSLYYFIDGTVSVGSMADADKWKAPESYSLPPGKDPRDIVGVAGTCANELKNAVIYAWYKDGTVSSGTYLDLDAYRAPYEYTLPQGKSIDLISSFGIACSDDHVYVWYWDGTVSSGMTNDLGLYREPRQFITPQ